MFLTKGRNVMVYLTMLWYTTQHGGHYVSDVEGRDMDCGDSYTYLFEMSDHNRNYCRLSKNMLDKIDAVAYTIITGLIVLEVLDLLQVVIGKGLMLLLNLGDKCLRKLLKFIMAIIILINSFFRVVFWTCYGGVLFGLRKTGVFLVKILTINSLTDRERRELEDLRKAKNDQFKTKTSLFLNKMANVSIIEIENDPEQQQPESVVVGSEIRFGHQTVPCSYVVYQRTIEPATNDIVYKPVGMGTRFNEFAIFPNHVFGSQDVFYINTSKKDQMVAIRASQVQTVAGDVSFVSLSLKEWSMIGVKSLDIQSVPSKPGIVGRCEGISQDGKGLYSTGRFYDSDIFGRVVYTGSTIKGFSGGLYLDGNKVIGMHLSGGKTYNQGVSMSYIKTFLDDYAKYKDGIPEGYDWLFQGYKGKNKKIQFQRTGDPGRIRIKAQGKYHLIETDVLAEHGIWAEDVEDPTNVYDYRDKNQREQYEGDKSLHIVVKKGRGKGRSYDPTDMTDEPYEIDAAFETESIPVPQPKNLPADPYNDSKNTLTQRSNGESGECNPAVQPRAIKLLTPKEEEIQRILKNIKSRQDALKVLQRGVQLRPQSQRKK